VVWGKRKKGVNSSQEGLEKGRAPYLGIRSQAPSFEEVRSFFGKGQQENRKKRGHFYSIVWGRRGRLLLARTLTFKLSGGCCILRKQESLGERLLKGGGQLEGRISHDKKGGPVDEKHVLVFGEGRSI